MQKHTRIYLKYFSYGEQDFIPCECCGLRCVDVHHVEPRSKFGKKRKDEQNHINNLVGLCRDCHNKAHANILTKDYLKQVHSSFMEKRKVA